MFVTHRELESNTLNALKHTWTQILLRHPADGEADRFCCQRIINVCLTSLNLLCMFACVWNIQWVFFPVPCWPCSDLALPSDLSVLITSGQPETIEDTLEIRLLSTHSEVVLARRGRRNRSNHWTTAVNITALPWQIMRFWEFLCEEKLGFPFPCKEMSVCGSTAVPTCLFLHLLLSVSYLLTFSGAMYSSFTLDYVKRKHFIDVKHVKLYKSSQQ